MFKSISSLLSGKQNTIASWEFFLFIKRTFTASEDIEIPSDKVLQMHSPKIDGELKVDGEVYIL